jgi:uncharacterized protein YecE (DUF72 family)
MDFGRLSNVDGVDFSLPPSGAQVFGPRRETRVALGVPSWIVPDFARRFYPRGTKPHEMLPAYARAFDSVELNSTFYALPSPETVETWKRQTPAHFRFCPKYPQTITHHKQLRDCAADVCEFAERLAPLGAKLGLAFLQLPPSLSPKDGTVLRDFLDLVPKTLPTAIEFRHEDWFERGAVKERVVEFLRARDIPLVITDVAGRRDVAHGSLSVPRTLVRCQGYELHPTDFTRLEAWADRLAEWRDQGLEEAYFFLHQEKESLSLDTAAAFAMALRERGFTALPDVQAWRQGRQENLF